MPDFRICGNCGWSCKREEMTWRWCDECCLAGLKGFLTAVTGALGLALVDGAIRLLARWTA